MLLRTTRRLSTQFSRTAALESKLARREASAAIQGAQEAPKLSRADAIEGRQARREAAALLQGAAEAASLTRRCVAAASPRAVDACDIVDQRRRRGRHRS